MSTAPTELVLRVFLASPGDVAEERAFVRELLESILPNDPWLPCKVRFEQVSWDHPHAGTPMLAHMTPQEAVTHFQGRPADCDLVIVLLYTRLGTHLDLATYKKPDGSAYLSGTEWEYEDAWNATPRPDILVYRRGDVPAIPLNDRDRKEKQRQYDLVEQFFERFKNPDGSWNGGVNSYSGIEEFREKVKNDLQHIINKRRPRPTPPAPPDPSSTTAPILPPARCFGRDDEATALIAALTTPSQAALLVLGSGGIGKTTLTRRVATDPAVIARFGTHRWFVELDTTTDAATLRTAIIQALGLPPATTDFAATLNVLSRQPALLVLDNLETPWEADQRAVQDVLQALATTPGVSLLASLRGRSAPSAPRWTRRPTELEPLPEPEARRLFLDLAPAAEDEPKHLNHFLKALVGIPLAVELVALQAASGIALRELWATWQRRGIELAAHPDLGPDRLTSLARSLDLSWQSPRLRQPGRRLFRMLGQLPAGIADPDREALLGDDAMPAAQQLRAIGLAWPRDGRLDLLPPVRDYAGTTHPPPPEDQEAWCRHYLSLARDIGGRIFGTGGAEAVIRLAPEVPNIVAALRTPEYASLRAEVVAALAVAALRGVARLLVATGAGSLLPLETLAAARADAADPAGEDACHLCRG